MKCELARIEIDNTADLRKAIGPEDLSSEARSHIEECPACARYFESASTAGDAIMNARLVEMPAGLHDRLVRLEDESRFGSTRVFSIAMIVHIVKTILPAAFIWVIGMFMPAAVSTLFEILLMVAAMVMAFEKIGRRLLTDRV